MAIYQQMVASTNKNICPGIAFTPNLGVAKLSTNGQMTEDERGKQLMNMRSNLILVYFSSFIGIKIGST